MITCLLRVPSPKTTSSPRAHITETSALVTTSRSRGEHGNCGNKGSQGGCGGRPQCFYCKRMGHIHDTCYSLHEFLYKNVNVSQAEIGQEEEKGLKCQKSKSFPYSETE